MDSLLHTQEHIKRKFLFIIVLLLLLRVLIEDGSGPYKSNTTLDANTHKLFIYRAIIFH